MSGQEQKQLRDFNHEQLMTFIERLQRRAETVLQRAQRADMTAALMLAVLGHGDTMPLGEAAKIEGQAAAMRNEAAEALVDVIADLLKGPDGRVL